MALGTKLREAMMGITQDDFTYTPLAPAQAARMKALDDQDRQLAEVRAMPFVQAKRYLMQDIILRRQPAYQWTDQHIEVLRRMTRWVWSMDDPEYDLSKGFLLVGHPGSGKTELMQCLSIWSIAIGKRPFHMCYAKPACDQALSSKQLQVDNIYFKRSWCIDEIGHEYGEASKNVWGNKVSYISNLLEHRYAHRLITHGTTNLEMDDTQSGQALMSQVYSKRVISRMYAMFNVVYLNGRDWRRG